MGKISISVLVLVGAVALVTAQPQSYNNNYRGSSYRGFARDLTDFGLMKLMSAIQGGGRGHRELLGAGTGVRSEYAIPSVNYFSPSGKSHTSYLAPPSRDAKSFYRGGRLPLPLSLQGARPSALEDTYILTSSGPSTRPRAEYSSQAPLDPAASSSSSSGDTKTIQEIVAQAAQEQHQKVLQREKLAHPGAQINQVLVQSGPQQQQGGIPIPQHYSTLSQTQPYSGGPGQPGQQRPIPQQFFNPQQQYSIQGGPPPQLLLRGPPQQFNGPAPGSQILVQGPNGPIVMVRGPHGQLHPLQYLSGGPQQSPQGIQYLPGGQPQPGQAPQQGQPQGIPIGVQGQQPGQPQQVQFAVQGQQPGQPIPPQFAVQGQQFQFGGQGQLPPQGFQLAGVGQQPHPHVQFVGGNGQQIYTLPGPHGFYPQQQQLIPGSLLGQPQFGLPPQEQQQIQNNQIFSQPQQQQSAGTETSPSGGEQSQAASSVSQVSVSAPNNSESSLLSSPVNEESPQITSALIQSQTEYGEPVHKL